MAIYEMTIEKGSADAVSSGQSNDGINVKRYVEVGKQLFVFRAKEGELEFLPRTL